MAKILTLLVLLMTAVTGAWATDYYLVGSMNNWAANAQYKLTQNPYNTEEYMITLTLEANAELKVIGVNGGTTTWYPDNEDNYKVKDTGNYTVYFRPDYGSPYPDWYIGCIYLSKNIEWTNIVANSDMEGTDVSCFYVHEQGKGATYLAPITAGIGKDDSRAIKLQSSDDEPNPWDTQFFIRLPYVLPAGTQYKLSFDYKADNNGDVSFQIANEPGQYVWYSINNDYVPGGSFTTSWQHYEETFTVPAVCDGVTKGDYGDYLKVFRTINFQLSLNKVATQFIFDNVKVEISKDVLATLTPEPATDPDYMMLYVTNNATNEWQFTMLDNDVEFEVEYETALALSETTDNSAALTEWDGYEADITLKRKLVAGSWNTLAVPFNVSSTLLGYLKTQYGMEVKELESSSLNGQSLTLNFKDAASIVAGTPYLVKVSSDYDFSARALPNVEVSQELNPVQTDYADFIPTLGKTLVTGPEGDKDNKDAVLFVAANNTLKTPTVVNDTEQESSYMKGFRAYFQLKDASTARSFVLNLGDESTGVVAIDNGQLIMDNSVYDLQGRKANAAQKGVYIVNGKKVIK